MEESDNLNLDKGRVDELIEEVYQKSEFHRPNNVEFILLEDPRQRATISISDDTLFVQAGAEPALKRALGRYLIQQSWPTINWVLATRLGTFVVLSTLLTMAIPSIALLLLYFLPALEVIIVWSAIILDTCFGIWLGFLVSTHHRTYRSKLAEKMVQLGCMTEYDGKDYEEKPTDPLIGSTLIVTFALFALFALLSFAPQTDMMIILIPLFPILFALLGFHCRSSSPFGDDPCLWSEEEDEYGHESPTLKQAILDVIERADFRLFLQEKHESFDDIRVQFRQSQGAQHRLFHDFAEDSTLQIQACDISEESCLRLGAATFALSSLPFFRDLSFKQRAMHVWAVLFGIGMLLVILGIGLVHGLIVGILFTVFTSIVFSWFWYKGHLLYEQVRRDFPKALEKTGVFTGYQVPFYAYYMHSTSRRGDFRFLIGFHIALFIILALIMISA